MSCHKNKKNLILDPPAATGSVPTNPVAKSSSSGFLPASPNSTAPTTGSVHTNDSSHLTKSRASNLLTTNPSSTAPNNNSSKIIVGYVHRVSPVKCNKRDILDYIYFMLFHIKMCHFG